MALFHSPFPCTTKNPNYLPLLHSLTRPNLTVCSQKRRRRDRRGRSGNPSASPPKKTFEPGQGFGSSSSASSQPEVNPASGKRGRASIIRRAPVQKPAFVGRVDEAKADEQGRYEKAFVLAWLGFGGVVLVEGIGLAASGFLPEEWDKLSVKYLYPAFTPTVFLFVAGTVVYGVLKYLQNEKVKGQSNT